MKKFDSAIVLNEETGYDLRDRVGASTVDDFYRLGSALARRLAERKNGGRGQSIVVAGDHRVTTPALKRAFIQGLENYPLKIIDLGEDLPTPLAYAGFEFYQADAVAIVTASHSSWEWNGIKINLRDLGDEEAGGQPERKKKPLRETDIRDFYKRYLQKRFLGLEQLRLVVDPLSGTYSGYALEVLRDSGHRVVSGAFLHGQREYFPAGLDELSSDPHKKNNLEHLIAEIKEAGRYGHHFDFGMAFDGDGDRIKFVDDLGEAVSEDEVTIIIGQYLLEQYHGQHQEQCQKNCRENPDIPDPASQSFKPRIIAEIKSSRLVEEMVVQSGGEFVREQTGRIRIKRSMAGDSRIIFGGELSGHYFYRRNFCGKPFYLVDTGEDVLFTALLLGQILKEKGQRLSEMRVAPYPSSGEIRYTYKKGQDPEEARKEIEDILAFLNDSYSSEPGYLKIGDDVRVEKTDHEGEYCSVVFRSSKNDPQKFTLVFEGRTRESLAYVQNDFLERLKGLEQIGSPEQPDSSGPKYSEFRIGLEKELLAINARERKRQLFPTGRPGFLFLGE